MIWRQRLNLPLAALAFAVLLHGVLVRDLRLVIPGAVLALVFGLEWIGVPLLGRWRRRPEKEAPPATRQPGLPPRRRQHVGPFWKDAQQDRAKKPAPPSKGPQARRPPNSRPRPRREERW